MSQNGFSVVYVQTSTRGGRTLQRYTECESVPIAEKKAEGLVDSSQTTVVYAEVWNRGKRVAKFGEEL